MKICLLSDAVSVHTKKWAEHFAEEGHSVHVLSFRKADINGVVVHHLGVGDNRCNSQILSKLKYLKSFFHIRSLLHKLKPDILHAHYATSYGLLGALTSYHPFIISVWGTDVFDFPKISFIHKKTLEFNLKNADYICSTSHIMAEETRKYTTKDITITPFGVDCQKFRPISGLINHNKFVVGTLKTLEEKYGIEYLIEAFSIVKKNYQGKMKLRLLIAGEGTLKKKLISLVAMLGINDETEFCGYIPNSEVPQFLNKFSVYVAISNVESFGVAVVEASSCGIPVIVSDAGGLPEVVVNNVTGFIVPRRDPESTAKAIIKLIEDEELRKKMGDAGRNFVLKEYEWNENASRMEKLYEKVVKNGYR